MVKHDTQGIDMRFRLKTKAEKQLKLAEWHRHFALNPVEVAPGEWVWGETVLRRTTDNRRCACKRLFRYPGHDGYRDRKYGEGIYWAYKTDVLEILKEKNG